MKLELIGHDEKYAVEQSLLTLFPDERPVYGPVTDEDASAARITLTEDADSVCVTTELRCGGKAAADWYSYPLSGTDYEKEGQRRHALGLSFFRAAKEVLGVTPAWGSLTGVRPSKVAVSLLREGKTPAAVLTELEEVYSVTPQRARLARTAVAPQEQKARVRGHAVCARVHGASLRRAFQPDKPARFLLRVFQKHPAAQIAHARPPFPLREISNYAYAERAARMLCGALRRKNNRVPPRFLQGLQAEKANIKVRRFCAVILCARTAPTGTTRRETREKTCFICSIRPTWTTLRA